LLTIVPVGGGPSGIVVGASRAYVANSLGNSVSVIDTTTNLVVATIPVGLQPTGVALTPDGIYLHVANQGSNTVSVIETATNTVVATVPVSAHPFALAIHFSGDRTYVTYADHPGLTVIDNVTNTIITTIPDVGQGYVALRGNRIVVTGYTGIPDRLAVVDAITNTLTAVIPLTGFPAGVDIALDGTKAYVAISHFVGNPGEVLAVDLSTNSVVASVPVGQVPSAFGLFIGGTTAPGVNPAIPALSWSALLMLAGLLALVGLARLYHS
jgi:YVTN family beta-propeller protein